MKLIVSIVNRGHCDELMSLARSAGAQGGTILNARGTSTEEDTTFFGIHLAPEKEMLLIVATPEDAPNIVEALKRNPFLCEPCAGIIFTLNIEDVYFLNN